MTAHVSRLAPIVVCRAYVQRASGAREVVYSFDAVPWWHLRRRLKLRAHLAFMRAEDRANGWEA